MNEVDDTSPSASRSIAKVAIAGLVLLVAGYIILKLVIGIVFAIAGPLALILAVGAVIWALKVLL